MIFGSCIMIIASLGLFIFRKDVLYMFVNDDDDDVIKLGIKTIQVLALGNVFDFFQSILNNICRGLRKQLLASIICFINFYVFQTSLSYLFAKVWNLGVFGIWFCILICAILCMIIYLIAVSFFNLKIIYKDTVENISADNNMNTEDKKNIKVRSSDL